MRKIQFYFTSFFLDDILKSLSLRRDVVATDGLLTQLRRFEASKDEAAKKKKKGSSEPDNKQYKQVYPLTTTTCSHTFYRWGPFRPHSVLPPFSFYDFNFENETKKTVAFYYPHHLTHIHGTIVLNVIHIRIFLLPIELGNLPFVCVVFSSHYLDLNAPK